MTESVMISVILPVYNVEKYLRECLDSLLNQEYQNFELIAVNDGSTDNSLSILQEYQSKFDKFILVNQKNKGLSEARNSGLRHVRGKYIYFLDSDDYILPETFKNLVNLAETNNLDLIKFDAKPFNEISGDFKMSDYDTSDILKENTLYNREEYAKLIRKKFMPPVWLYFIRSSVIMDNNLRFKKNILHEDELFTVQLLKECNRIMYDSNQYFQRRYRSNSIMTNRLNSNLKSFESKIAIIAIFNEMLESLDANSHFYKFVRKRRNALYTTLFFYKLEESYPKKNKIKNIEANFDWKTFLIEFKKYYL